MYAICTSHNIFKKHDELQFEEHDGVNRGAASTRVGLLHELPHEREIKGVLQVPVEVILRY